MSYKIVTGVKFIIFTVLPTLNQRGLYRTRIQANGNLDDHLDHLASNIEDKSECGKISLEAVVVLLKRKRLAALSRIVTY